MTTAHPHRRIAVLATVAGAVLALASVLAVWQPWAPKAVPVPLAAGEDAVTVDPLPLDLPADATVLVFGDSWTYGSAATTPTGGYAYLLAGVTGYTTVVDGVRGSGYLKPGLDGPSFGDRIAELDPSLDPDLVIVQGSINDRKQDLSTYEEAVDAAWDALAAIYPDADIVILGPAPQVLPVEKATAQIDEMLSGLAAERGWWYISPIVDRWITAGNYDDVIDTSDTGNDHPSDDGHAYLARRLAAALADIALPVTSTADD